MKIFSQTFITTGEPTSKNLNSGSPNYYTIPEWLAAKAKQLKEEGSTLEFYSLNTNTFTYTDFGSTVYSVTAIAIFK